MKCPWCKETLIYMDNNVFHCKCWDDHKLSWWLSNGIWLIWAGSSNPSWKPSPLKPIGNFIFR